jgi:Arc/MetJ-type ribon-helix-helix transcriptional regulator
MSKKEVRINARVPRNLKDLMQQFTARDTHMNESDLIRDAIREKIQREAPELYRQLFERSKGPEGKSESSPVPA